MNILGCLENLLLDMMLSVTCIQIPFFAAGGETDGSLDPDDGNQHGTACRGWQQQQELADGSQSDFYACTRCIL